jgi:hypothetical protein
MTGQWLLLAFIAFFIGLRFYKRDRAPDLLNEIENGLRLVGERDRALGNTVRAEKFLFMSNAIEQAQRYLNNGQDLSEKEAMEIHDGLLLATSEEVHLSIGVFRPDHAEAWRAAVNELCVRFVKAYPQ